MNVFEKIRKVLVKELKCYTSISDLPIYNWFKIHETNDLKYILIEEQKVGFMRQEELSVVFSKIYDEFLDTFGISDDLKRISELRRDIRVLEIDMYLYNDMSKETFIDIKKAELDSIVYGKSKAKLNDVKGYVEKYMGFKLDDKITAVKDYYSYIEMMNLEAKKQPING